LDEKYAEAEMWRGGGMENPTCPSVSPFSEFVSAHELGHQWWGDLVTCRNFHEIWLNEGFASYCEALWAEASQGVAGYRATLEAKKYLGPGTVYVPSDSSTGRIFDYNLSYSKGAWTLHMLRHVLSDSTFFAALREYR